MEAILTPSAAPTRRAGTAQLWVSRVLSALLVLFLLVDALGKILRLAPYVEGTAKAGFPPGSLVPMGIALLVGTVLYAIPRTAVVGAIVLTAYLGGATAAHVRLGQPFWFPVMFGVIAWGALYLRDARVRALVRSAV